MINHMDTEVFSSDSKSLPASSDHRFEVDRILGFGEIQDTEPIEEAITLDDDISLLETPFQKLDEDTELVDNEETLDLGFDEVVGDSEDEDEGNGSVAAAESSLKAVDTLLESDGSNDQKCHTGLGFLDSQEPGESTQENALGFVDQFLMDKDLNFSPVGLAVGTSCRKKSPPFSGAKGRQSLVKRIKASTPTKKRSVFDWDSDQCDVSDPQKSPVTCANSTCSKRREDHVADDDTGVKKGSMDPCENRKVSTHPAKKLMQNSSAKHHKTGKGSGIMNISQMDAQLQDKESMEQLELKEDFTDIGVNTQIAAEAMSALLYAPCTKEEACESVPIPGMRISETRDRVSSRSRRDNDTIEEEPERDNWSGPFGAQEKGKNSKRKRNFTKIERTRTNNSAINCLLNYCEWRHPRAKRSRLMQSHHVLSRIPWVSSSVADGSGANTLSSRLLEPLSGTGQASSCQSGVSDSDVANHVSPRKIYTESHERSSNKDLPKPVLLKELSRLGGPGKVCDLRRRRNLAHVRVLFSQNLDAETVKQQKKIMVRLGISQASSSADSTHFIADRFARTRNMLEAIALGKPVVTPLWLESCGQTRCLIDEKSYILTDGKMVKDGFCMLTSLARAKQRPLLKGLKVCITPNIKPSRGMIADLVKVTQGQVVEISEIIASEDRNFPENVLFLSCEEDRDLCLPFIKQGAVVYTSELLLNGIVIQKLEYGRHGLFSIGDKRTKRNTKFTATRPLLSAY